MWNKNKQNSTKECNNNNNDEINTVFTIELENVIRKLKTNKAYPAWLWPNNKWLVYGLTPIFKSGDDKDAGNYWVITLLKLYGQIVHKCCK